MAVGKQQPEISHPALMCVCVWHLFPLRGVSLFLHFPHRPQRPDNQPLSELAWLGTLEKDIEWLRPALIDLPGRAGPFSLLLGRWERLPTNKSLSTFYSNADLPDDVDTSEGAL